MSSPNAYVREIKSIRKERKRILAKSKSLLQQQKEAERHLYNYMIRNGCDTCDGITIKSITPKEKVVRKKKAKKKEDAIDLFRKSGIIDPEDFWNQLQATQTNQSKPKESFDLGF